MTTKQCFKCKRRKRLDLFYKHPAMGDGHLGKCKACTKKDVNERYADPEANKRIRSYERRRFQDPKRKAKIRVYRAAMRQRNHGKALARSRLANALRAGKLQRLPCEVCMHPQSQGHHTDYRKPLQVKWLCFKHHREEHGQKVA